MQEWKPLNSFSWGKGWSLLAWKWEMASLCSTSPQPPVARSVISVRNQLRACIVGTAVWSKIFPAQANKYS